MTFLTADKTYTTDNGIMVCQKILPAGQRPNRKLNTTGNKPAYITIHNTPDINEANGTNDAEQYARATFNGNMNGVTVHFYIDETGCWQILPLDEIGYHAADGANGPGNSQSLAIEIIMDGRGKTWDKNAEDRGAKLAAYLLHQYGLGIDRMVTHQHWYPKKYCPQYILPHWGEFVDKVKKYLATLNAPKKTIDELAQEVLDRKWGNGEERKQKLTAAGYDYNAVQKRVTELVAEREKAEAAAKAAAKAKAEAEALKPDGGDYLVTVGAYSTAAKAEAMAAKLKAAGFDAYVTVAGDMDGDGKVTAEDARRALRKAVGLKGV